MDSDLFDGVRRHGYPVGTVDAAWYPRDLWAALSYLWREMGEELHISSAPCSPLSSYQLVLETLLVSIVLPFRPIMSIRVRTRSPEVFGIVCTQ
jgi:hypothetical protein